MQGGRIVKVAVRNRCSHFETYRAARVRSLFNVESGADFSLDADLPIEEDGWKIGVIVGPSGSGKSSLGRELFGGGLWQPAWPEDRPIVDAILPGGDFDAVTSALAAVGLGSVPAWLRPYGALSTGERFRADLARLVAESPDVAVVDEFTSVVDRQIAKIGSFAFQKAWRRAGGKAVLLTCHYDVLEWLEPDWVYDTATGKYSGRGLQRPRFELCVWQTDARHWPAFEPHHYLKLPQMVAATYYVGTVDGELVAHVAVSPRFQGNCMRACRLVVMPEWQGAGVGTRFLNAVCQMQLDGINRWARKLPTLFHTSHPGLASALRRDRRWIQVSRCLFGDNKAKSRASIKKSATAKGGNGGGGYGGHLRGVQGFKFVGAA